MINSKVMEQQEKLEGQVELLKNMKPTSAVEMAWVDQQLNVLEDLLSGTHVTA